jgi:TolA-binding protein
MLGLANSQAEMKDKRAARKTLENLQRRYPDSDAAQAAAKRLAALR